jgi:oligopeptide/dipeptide ABC transporter ATP-binding protein
MGDDVAVMYAGRIVEHSANEALFESPQHPYTIGLFGSIPEAASGTRLRAIQGRVPLPSERLAGCRFAPRCPFAAEPCGKTAPKLTQVAAGQSVACWLAPLEMGAA